VYIFRVFSNDILYKSDRISVRYFNLVVLKIALMLNHQGLLKLTVAN